MTTSFMMYHNILLFMRAVMFRKYCFPISYLFILLLYCLPALADNIRTIDWDDLLPQTDLDALLNPPEYLNDIDDSSFEAQISSGIERALTLATDDAYQQALVSTNIVHQMNDQHIRLPGFIVPLTYDAEQRVKTFFLVPYFGACIHVPPPPPNQIVYGDSPEGIAITDIYDAYWLSGVLHTTLTENDMAISAYSINVTSIEPYEEVMD